MKITLVQRKQEDIEVEIRYPEMNSYVEELVKKLRASTIQYLGMSMAGSTK